ncbi:Na+/H+ antiporter NhaC [Marinicella sp. S1101]|uniref:Na+/H+ antiporter NhaC n=1 Tax=Marinicella marina TaxID=2996016 RepID=UPI002260A57E|nr:Na+/H+ antiporter NhaC [Marinicella marina]MCX7555041.1 Na+/H+ antiporter NhaC [Marinicella marina]MDJ1141295.1 Na+/H+ antiporter NhaC [Marinicella marina]
MNKKVSFLHAFMVFVGLLLCITTGMFFWGGQLHVALFLGLIWVVVNATALGYRYLTIREMMNGAISRALPAFYIFMLIGLVIAALMKSGTVATLIYYGLDWLSPQWFLPVGFILCALMSVLTGTSWGTVGTLGVVFMGMAAALEIPLYWAAGMVISGATFGDKMSPISDTTNLAAMSSDTDLYAHIRSMMMTTVPTFVIVLLLFAVIGYQFVLSDDTLQQAQNMQITLAEEFYLNPLVTLLPVVVMAVLSYRRMPAEVSMTSCVLVAVLIAVLVQQTPLTVVVNALWSNTPATTGIDSLDALLGRGGLYAMAWTLLLAIIAVALGGVLQGAGFVLALLRGLIARIQSTGSLIASTIVTGLLSVIAMSEAYIAIILNSEIYKKVYRERGIDTAVLSRSVEEGTTLMAPLIPWSTAGAFYAATLGVAVVEYAPFALLNIINPLLAILFAYLGLALIKSSKKNRRSISF